ncbi:Uncharacterised protein [Streptococcus pneumoniae]|nr:Uncharacterised protein [Streptococcus pneumoniae]
MVFRLGVNNWGSRKNPHFEKEKEVSFQANLSDFYDCLIAKNRQNGKCDK